MNKILLGLVLSLGTWAFTPSAVAAVSVSIHIAPPMLPIYVQPAPPPGNFLWMPGYWAWDDEGYFWVPGTWVLAPQRGYLWTPGYWSWGSGFYHWHSGYWGPTVGYYGGVHYGYGYYGTGYHGGRWQGDRFYYNSTVNNVNVTHIHNTYHEPVANHTRTVNRVSYNGGQGGTVAKPSERERNAGRERRDVTPDQTRHERAARGNRALRASVNKGTPPIAATPRPAAFNDREVRPAKRDPAPGPEQAPQERKQRESGQRQSIPQQQRQQQQRQAGQPGAAQPEGEPDQKGNKDKRQQKDKNARNRKDAEAEAPAQ